MCDIFHIPCGVELYSCWALNHTGKVAVERWVKCWMLSYERPTTNVITHPCAFFCLWTFCDQWKVWELKLYFHPSPGGFKKKSTWLPWYLFLLLPGTTTAVTACSCSILHKVIPGNTSKYFLCPVISQVRGYVGRIVSPQPRGWRCQSWVH